MLLAGSDALLALACLWAGRLLWALPGRTRPLALAIMALVVPSAAGAARFAGYEAGWLLALHQGASDLYALLGFASVAAALFLLPDGRRWPLILGIAVAGVAGLVLAGQPALSGPVASLFILVASLRLLLKATGSARRWLGLSMLAVITAALTRVPGLLDADSRIIGLHLGLAAWVLALGVGVGGYRSSSSRMV